MWFSQWTAICFGGYSLNPLSLFLSLFPPVCFRGSLHRQARKQRLFLQVSLRYSRLPFQRRISHEAPSGRRTLHGNPYKVRTGNHQRLNYSLSAIFGERKYRPVPAKVSDLWILLLQIYYRNCTDRHKNLANLQEQSTFVEAI